MRASSLRGSGAFDGSFQTLIRTLSVVLSVLLLAWPGAAFAGTPALIVPWRLCTVPGAVGLTTGVVFIAFLVNRISPKKRKRVHRTAVVHLLFLLAYGSHLLLVAIDEPTMAVTAGCVAEVAGLLTLVNIAALLVFAIVLPTLNVEVAVLVADLAVGAGYLIATFVSLQRFGVDLSSIVATSALMSTIIAFSLQNTLSNVFGGMALQIDESIHPGDWVQLENGKQGKVKEIRWRYTVIETRDWDTLIVPNASLLAANLIILGKREGEAHQHRMWVYFNVDFRFNPQEVIGAVDAALQGSPIEGVAKEPKPHCIVMDFAKDNRDSFAYYAIRYWLTDLARDDPTSSKVRQRLYTALKRAGIPLAVPAGHVWVEADDAASKERKITKETRRRLKALEDVDLFDPLTDQERAEVAPNLHYAPFCNGETISRQGAVAHHLYILTSGTTEIRVAVEGAEKIVNTIQAPGFFGEMGLMAGEPRQATVVAMTDVECYRLDKADLQRIVGSRPEMATEISAILAKRRVELMAVREGLTAAQKERRMDAEQVDLLSRIQNFFGMKDDNPASRG